MLFYRTDLLCSCIIGCHFVFQMHPKHLYEDCKSIIHVPLYTPSVLSKLYDVSVGFVTPPTIRRRVSVTRMSLICSFIIFGDLIFVKIPFDTYMYLLRFSFFLHLLATLWHLLMALGINFLHIHVFRKTNSVLGTCKTQLILIWTGYTCTWCASVLGPDGMAMGMALFYPFDSIIWFCTTER